MEQGGWSKDNNILLQDSGVSVFIDRSRKAVERGLHWKMITSKAAYQSSDGLYWYELPFAPTAYDDTKPTAYWDSTLGKRAQHGDMLTHPNPEVRQRWVQSAEKEFGSNFQSIEIKFPR